MSNVVRGTRLVRHRTRANMNTGLKGSENQSRSYILVRAVCGNGIVMKNRLFEKL